MSVKSLDSQQFTELLKQRFPEQAVTLLKGQSIVELIKQISQEESFQYQQVTLDFDAFRELRINDLNELIHTLNKIGVSKFRLIGENLPASLVDSVLNNVKGHNLAMLVTIQSGSNEPIVYKPMQQQATTEGNTVSEGWRQKMASLTKNLVQSDEPIEFTFKCNSPGNKIQDIVMNLREQGAKIKFEDEVYIIQMPGQPDPGIFIRENSNSINIKGRAKPNEVQFELYLNAAKQVVANETEKIALVEHGKPQLVKDAIQQLHDEHPELTYRFKRNYKRAYQTEFASIERLVNQLGVNADQPVMQSNQPPSSPHKPSQ